MTNITTVIKPNNHHHSSKVIVHDNNQNYLAEFNNMKQLDKFAETLGFTYKLIEERSYLGYDDQTCRCYEMSHNIKNEQHEFWKREEVPEDAKPIKALSNGSLVACYFVNDGKNITIFRPNPNASVYNPLPISEKIAHHKIYGIY